MNNKQYMDYCSQFGLNPTKSVFMELLAVAAAREIPEGSCAFVGTGLPLLAASLAQRTSSPNMMMILEAGTIDPKIEHLPLSVADPRSSYGASMLSTLADAFGTVACRGYCTVGILGAAECDMYGNLNSTSIGGYWPAKVSPDGKGPEVRLTGSGGASCIASLADRIIVMMVHEKRRFPKRVEYMTSCCGRRGEGMESRDNAGFFRGGEVCVISDMGILRNDPDTGILFLSNTFPGVSPEEVKNNTGWDLDVSRTQSFEEPTFEELMTLRLKVDPARLFLGRKNKRDK
jgi:glutaconate CoA-transferase subunit B